MTSNSKKTLLGTLSAALVFAHSVPLGAHSDHKSCTTEARNFCADVQQGQGRLVHCLNRNRQRLSTHCRHRVNETLEKLPSLRKNCASEVRQFCAAIRSGEGRVYECLAARVNDLSPACRVEVLE